MIREDIVRVETTTASSAPPTTSGDVYDIHQVDDAVVHEREYEPDMAQIVESLREDLIPEEQRDVPDISRKRKMTISSSSSSSSDSESEKEVEGIPQETKKITITESVTEVTSNGDVGSKDIVDGHVYKPEETIEKVCVEIVDEKKDERSSASSSDDENIKEKDDITVTEVRRESTSSSSSSDDDDDSKKPKSTEKSSKGDVIRKEETVEVKREVIEVTKKSDETEEDQIASTKQTDNKTEEDQIASVEQTDNKTEEDKTVVSESSTSSSDEETTKKEETVKVERVVTEITKKEVFTNEDQVPQPDEKQEDKRDIVEKTRTGSQSSSSSSDDEADTRPGCEVTITQTTIVKITEERPTKEVKELPSWEQTPPRSRSSSSSSDDKSPKLKKRQSSESGGYSSGSSSEGLESKTRIFPEVERHERFELEEKEVISKGEPISTTDIPDSGI